MTLSEKTSAWKHVQDVLIKVQNRIVKEEFSDVGDDNWQENIGTPRDSLRLACTLKKSDSSILTLLRLWLFYICLRKAQDLQAPVYGLPIDVFQEEVKFRPQIKLYFSQDRNAVPDGLTPVQSEITFRLPDETSSSMTETKAKALGQEIKNLFGSGGDGFVWTKGKLKITYLDPEHGYDFRINTNSKTEGEELIKKVLQIKNHTFIDDKLNVVTPNKNSINNPTQTMLVYEKQRRVHRWRPTANVRFRWASLHLHNLSKPVVICDITGTFLDALVK